jgi:hypothetical protein
MLNYDKEALCDYNNMEEVILNLPEKIVKDLDEHLRLVYKELTHKIDGQKWKAFVVSLRIRKVILVLDYHLLKCKDEDVKNLLTKARELATDMRVSADVFYEHHIDEGPDTSTS